MLLLWDNYVPDFALPDLEKVPKSYRKNHFCSLLQHLFYSQQIFILSDKGPQPTKKSGG